MTTVSVCQDEGGDEVWWHFDINSNTVNCRTLFWQQKLYDVDLRTTIT